MADGVARDELYEALHSRRGEVAARTGRLLVTKECGIMGGERRKDASSALQQGARLASSSHARREPRSHACSGSDQCRPFSARPLRRFRAATTSAIAQQQPRRTSMTSVALVAPPSRPRWAVLPSASVLAAVSHRVQVAQQRCLLCRISAQYISERHADETACGFTSSSATRTPSRVETCDVAAKPAKMMTRCRTTADDATGFMLPFGWLFLIWGVCV